VSDDSAFVPIGELGRRLRAGATTSMALTRACLDRLTRLGPRFNCLVTLVRTPALEEARRADAELAGGRDRGPLHGIPYGVKDLCATAGVPTTWGATPLRHQVFDFDATVVRRLRDAGAVLVAKLAMVELAGGMGYDQADASFSGPGRNPWEPDSWSGGSSSGPGSAVAAGLVPFAIGSETWGSILTPAGFCGITGLRPTYGRVSRHGAMALSWTMDKLGPMARSALDCDLVLTAIAGPDAADPTTLPDPYTGRRVGDRPPFRLAVPKGAVDKVQPAVRDNFVTALDVLRRQATLSTVELPDLPYNAVALVILRAEAASAFDAFLRAGKAALLTAPEDHWGGFASAALPAADYIHALRVRRRIRKALDELLEPYDALVSPTLECVANPISARFSEYFAPFDGPPISGAGNAGGLPALTVPNGFGERGLPTSLQFAGRAGSEARLLSIAAAYQDATDWHLRQPPGL